MSTLETLSRVTGIKTPQMDAIFQQVKANQKLLKECVRPHDFSICIDRRTNEPIPARVFGCKWKCSKCGGTVDQLQKSYYDEGLKDASNL